MKEIEIINSIEQKVMSFNPKKYSVWTIGITNNPDERRAKHDAENKNTKYWMYWAADNETIARNVEKHFLDKGVQGGAGGGENPTYVYIF